MFEEGGARLAEERRRLGMNQDAMAVAAGVAKSTYCNYEAGKRAPDALFLEKIAAAGGDVLYILTGTKSPSALTADEHALLMSYRSMDQRGRAGVIAMIAGLTQPAGTTIKIGGTVSQVVQGNATFESPVDFTVAKEARPKKPKKNE